MKKIILICLSAILLIGIVFYLVTRQIHIKSDSLSDYHIFDAYVDQKLSDEGMMIFPDADTVKQYSKSNVSNEVRKNEESDQFPDHVLLTVVHDCTCLGRKRKQ